MVVRLPHSAFVNRFHRNRERLRGDLCRVFCRPHLEALEDRCLPATFLVTNTNNDGPGSLRDAIIQANNLPGLDTIAFSIGGGGLQTIRPSTMLPSITDPVIIDGTTQPGYVGRPLIELNGANAGSSSGLSIQAGNSIVQGLVVNGFQTGVTFNGSGGNRITGCYLGTDPTGTFPVANRSYGISVGSNNTIGGTLPASRNIISGNLLAGINLGQSNLVLGNYIGTDASGEMALPNGRGVNVIDSNNIIGGMMPGAHNLISGNRAEGVQIAGGAIAPGNVNNRVEGNYIGTDATGTTALPNSVGVSVSGNIVFRHTIGGSDAGSGNLISGNLDAGIKITGVAQIRVEGNTIGVDATGANPLPNRVGILITSGTDARHPAVGNIIGTPAAGSDNLIAGNLEAGVEMVGTYTSGNPVQGNWIGVGRDGTSPLGNGTHGVYLHGGARNSTIGGLDDNAGNVIAYNGGSGVFADGPENSIRRNLFFGDTDLGIRLQGFDPPGFPSIDSATSSADGLTLNGTLSGVPQTDFALEFFANTVCHSSGFGEGATYLGMLTVSTDDFGQANFQWAVGVSVPPNQFITATATGLAADMTATTSGFSTCILVTDSGAPRVPGTHRGERPDWALLSTVNRETFQAAYFVQYISLLSASPLHPPEKGITRIPLSTEDAGTVDRLLTDRAEKPTDAACFSVMAVDLVWGNSPESGEDWNPPFDILLAT